MAAGHVRAHEFTHLRIDAADDLLHEQSLGMLGREHHRRAVDELVVQLFAAEPPIRLADRTAVMQTLRDAGLGGQDGVAGGEDQPQQVVADVVLPGGVQRV